MINPDAAKKLIEAILCKDVVEPTEEIKQELIEALNSITPREQKVIKLRFGLEDGQSRTLEEVRKETEFNVTRERIRQIEAKALRKLRHPTRSKRIIDNG